MKTKQPSLATVSSDVTVRENKLNATPPSAKNRLSQFIKLALVGSVMASNMATAALRDHGPADPTLGWPSWYRDLGNPTALALGLCKSTAPSPDPAAALAPMCFALVPDPAGFAGNQGPEIFYMNLNSNIANGGIDLRYVTGLEAAYANASGVPTKGTETVFARVRFTMHVTPGVGCAGTYRIIHPWGDNTFPDVPEGRRALFETFDVPLGALLDFEGALKGPIGPFLHWDDGFEAPLARTAVNGLKVGAEEFIGDPSILHSFTGSPLVEFAEDAAGQIIVDAAGNPVPKYAVGGGQYNPGDIAQHQNYLKVIAPAGCDIGGTPAPAGEGINVKKEPLGNLMGQVWTAPIATATKVTQAQYSRTAQSTIVDVWAESAPNQTLLLTGTGLKGVKMTEELSATGVKTGRYEAHLQFTGSVALPTIVHVVNTSSNPVVDATTALTDVIRITKAEYNPVTNSICVSANSSDKVAPAPQAVPALTVNDPIFGGALTSAAKATCPAAVAGDVTFTKTVAPGVPGPLNRAPKTLQIVSDKFASSTEQTLVLTGTADNTAQLVAGDDTLNNVSGGNPSTLAVGANDTAGTTITIVSQPVSTVTGKVVGTVVPSATAGSVVFTPAPGTSGVVQFTYVVKNAAAPLPQVSNLATVTLNTVFAATAATGNPDNFAILRTNTLPGFTKNVLKNDVAAVGSPINPASVKVRATINGASGTTATAGRGTVTANPDGTVTYKANAGATAGADSFYYTVDTNSVPAVTSAPIKVDVVVENTAENVTITLNRFTNQAGGLRWGLRGNSSWAAAPLTSTASCYLTRVNGVNVPTARFIASAPIDNTAGAAGYQIAVVGTKQYNDPTYNPNVDVPLVPSKATYTVTCATDNSVVPLTVQNALTAAPPSTALATSTATAP